jgi:hypothetical protein
MSPHFLHLDPNHQTFKEWMTLKGENWTAGGSFKRHYDKSLWRGGFILSDDYSYVKVASLALNSTMKVRLTYLLMGAVVQNVTFSELPFFLSRSMPPVSLLCSSPKILPPTCCKFSLTSGMRISAI